MIYENILPAVFVDRPNRFIAHVELNGRLEVCHVKNTGRCRELLEAHRTQLDAVAQYLLEHETMERDAFLKVFGETEPSEEA